MPDRQSSLEARIQIWYSPPTPSWRYAVDFDATRDTGAAFTKWGARFNARRLARRMARNELLRRTQSEDYTIEVRP